MCYCTCIIGDGRSGKGLGGRLDIKINQIAHMDANRACAQARKSTVANVKCTRTTPVPLMGMFSREVKIKVLN